MGAPGKVRPAKQNAQGLSASFSIFAAQFSCRLNIVCQDRLRTSRQKFKSGNRFSSPAGVRARQRDARSGCMGRLTEVTNVTFCAIYIKTITSPRQARDKHIEKALKTRGVFRRYGGAVWSGDTQSTWQDFNQVRKQRSRPLFTALRKLIMFYQDRLGTNID